MAKRSIYYLWFELLAIFVAAPTAFALWRLLGRGERWLIPGLWIMAAGSMLLLLTDKSFDRRELFRIEGIGSAGRGIVLRFVPLGTLMAVIMYVVWPEHFLNFPRQVPVIWALVMVLYPVFSVLPQSVTWRSLYLHRYRRLNGEGWPAIVGGAALFGYGHIVLGNLIAPLLTFIGGLMFLSTHRKYRSLPIAALEHALYGCWAFTLGYGEFLYGGAQRAAGGG